MSQLKFTDLISFSNQEIYAKIIETENELLNLRLKQATRQELKSHEISKTKRRLAQFKTLLTLRFKDLPESK